MDVSFDTMIERSAAATAGWATHADAVVLSARAVPMSDRKIRNPATQSGGERHQERVRHNGEVVPLALGDWGGGAHAHVAVGSQRAHLFRPNRMRRLYGTALTCGDRAGPRHGSGEPLHAPPGRGEKARTYNVLRAKTLCDARTLLSSAAFLMVSPSPVRPI